MVVKLNIQLTFSASFTEKDTEIEDTSEEDSDDNAGGVNNNEKKKKRRVLSPIRLEEREMCPYEKLQAQNIRERKEALDRFEEEANQKKLEEEVMQKKSEEEANQKQLEAGTRTRDQIMNWGSENLDLE